MYGFRLITEISHFMNALHKYVQIPIEFSSYRIGQMFFPNTSIKLLST